MKDKVHEYFFEYPDFENVKDLVYYSVNRFRNNTAFIIKEKDSNGNINYTNITFEQFLEDINDLGTGFFSLGLQDKKIAVISKNRYEWTLTFTTTLLGNMVTVPLDKGLTEIEIENSILRCEPDAIVFDSGLKDTIENLRKKGNIKIDHYIAMDDIKGYQTINELKEIGKNLRKAGNLEYEKVKIDSYKTSELCFTSGTSSTSKIVMLSHRNIAFDISAMHPTEDFRETDVNLAFLPFHHTFGSTGILFIFSYGAATAFPDGLKYISQNLKEYGVSVFIGVPLLVESIYKRIIKEIEKQGKTKSVNFARKLTNLAPHLKRKVFKPIIDQLGGKLRLIISGAAGLDKDVWKAFNELGIKVIQGYGLTEGSPVVAAENAKYGKRGSIGFPMRGIDVKVVDKNELGIGELAFRGDNMMLGYYNDKEATDKIMKDGWLLTGDLAYIDSEGYIFIAGRKKNVIVLKNGKNVYPEEIESLVNKLPFVKESMVFGMEKSDDLVVSAKIQYNEEYFKENYPNADDALIKQIVWDKIKEVNKSLPTYKYIKNIIVTKDDFIKTTTAKIKRYEEMKKIKYA